MPLEMMEGIPILERIQNSHSDNQKAISATERDRTFRTKEQSVEADTTTILNALKSIITRLDRLELLIRTKYDDATRDTTSKRSD